MTGQSTADRANRIPWPPILYVVVAAVAYGLERVWPLPLAYDGLKWPGVLIALAGFGVAVAGASYFRSIGTPVDPTGSAKHLATGGLYRWTRNPMYLGGVILFTGLSLAFRSGWLLALVPVIAIGLQKLAIEREEAYLRRRFGDAYRAYCATVRRWI
jgi:protein-S-isoprenylcysteine O-methyltransferase Ste14